MQPPLGIGVLAGRSGIRALTGAWSEDLPVRIAGCVPDAATGSLEPLLLRRSDRCAQLGLLAARQAWAMATGAIAGIDPARVAVVLGTGIGGLHTMHEQHNQLTAGGPTRVNPLTVPMLIPDAAAGQVAIDLGLHGGAHTPVSACASGAEAMMLAQMLLNDGRADLVLAGGTEAPVNRLGLVGFSAMRALSCRNDAPDQASRPYSKDRDGFVLSEGAGVLAMMREEDTPSGTALGWQPPAAAAATAITSWRQNPRAPRPAWRSRMLCGGRGWNPAISVPSRPTPPAPVWETLLKQGRCAAAWALPPITSRFSPLKASSAICWEPLEPWRRFLDCKPCGRERCRGASIQIPWTLKWSWLSPARRPSTCRTQAPND